MQVYRGFLRGHFCSHSSSLLSNHSLLVKPAHSSANQPRPSSNQVIPPQMSSASPSDQQDSPQDNKSKFYTAREEKKWNQLSEKMSSFHEYFKEEFNTVYELADGSFTKRGLSLPRYLDTAKAMNHRLTMHHTIEERYIFPVLAKYMPKFANTDEGAHIASHRGIHDGLEKLDALVTKWKGSPSTYSLVEMRSCLDGFRDVLFHHLDEEVADLRGENLKKYMTLAQVEAVAI